MRKWARLGTGCHEEGAQEAELGQSTRPRSRSDHTPWGLSSKDQLLLSNKKVDPVPVSRMNM